MKTPETTCPPDYPQTLQDALDFLELKTPPCRPEYYGLMINGLRSLIERYGMETMKAQRASLVEQLEWIDKM